MQLDIAKPDDPDDKLTVLQPWPASRTMTILLGKNNQAVYFLGEADKNLMQVTSIAEIRKALLDNKKRVSEIHRANKDQSMYVIVKPTSTSVFKDFVSVVDEIRINNINTYAIDDKYLLDEEAAFMKNKGI